MSFFIGTSNPNNTYSIAYEFGFGWHLVQTKRDKNHDKATNKICIYILYIYISHVLL